MKLHDIMFKRRFSINFHGNLKLKMGEMSFHKNFINDLRGDPYPSVGDPCLGVRESVGSGQYSVHFSMETTACDEQNDSLASEDHAEKATRIKRLMGGFFPWHVYELDFSFLRFGSIGLAVDSCEGRLEILLSSKGHLEISTNGEHSHFDAPDFQKTEGSHTLTVSFRTGGVTVYLGRGGQGLQTICDLKLPLLDRLRREAALSTAHTYLLTEVAHGGSVVVERVEWFLTAGLSQADLRAVKYENGKVMLREGRVFLTASARLEAGGYQLVLSWNPSACDFRLEGALFFDCGDGYLCSDVASSIVYDRTRSRWLIWMCAFSHGHILARTETANCPLFGIQYIDVELMEKAEGDAPLTAFKGFSGDEDPDLILSDGKWHLAICRLDGKGYKYYHFVSDSPLDGFRYVDHTTGIEKTGGSFVLRHDGGISFVCGSDFGKRAVYDVYPLEDFTVCEHLRCDFDDGGFRGWGAVMLLPFGTRRRYTWVTFDRHNATAYNWSYGNVYVFDSESVL